MEWIRGHSPTLELYDNSIKIDTVDLSSYKYLQLHDLFQNKGMKKLPSLPACDIKPSFWSTATSCRLQCSDQKCQKAVDIAQKFGTVSYNCKRPPYNYCWATVQRTPTKLAEKQASPSQLFRPPHDAAASQPQGGVAAAEKADEGEDEESDSNSGNDKEKGVDGAQIDDTTDVLDAADQNPSTAWGNSSLSFLLVAALLVLIGLVLRRNLNNKTSGSKQ